GNVRMRVPTLKPNARSQVLFFGSSAGFDGHLNSRFTTALSGGLAALVILAGYVLFEWVTLIHEHKGVPITPWNPGLGLVLAFMVLAGARFAVGLFVGVVIPEFAVLRSNLWWPVIIGIAAIIAVGYGLVAKLACGTLRLDAGVNRL